MKRILAVVAAIWLVLISTALAAGGSEWIEEFEISVPEGANIHYVSDISPNIQPGEYVQFGCYPQTAQGNDQTPIEWLVLDVKDNKALLISRYGLDAQRFDASKYRGWDKSEMRSWLNSTFLNNAFTAKEQKGIVATKISTPSYSGKSGGSDTQDKLWLLSRDEATTYFGNDEARKAIPTKYAVAQGAFQNSKSINRYKLNGTACCWWWLRSPGYYGYGASSVHPDGSFYNCDVDNTSGSVRPAFWLNLDSADIY